VSEKGDNQIAIVTGANNTLTILDVMKAEETLKNTKVLVCQLETPPLATIEALAIFNGISILNGAPAIDKYHDDLMKFPTIFCVNETEAASFANMSTVDLDNVKEAIEKLLQKGCNTVVVTLGAQGAVFASKNDPRPVHVKAPKVLKAIDTTGAGDAFIGSLAYFLSKYSIDQMSMQQKVGAACEIASLSVQHEGTQSSFPKIDDPKVFLAQKYDWNYL
jgi:ribokinase